MSRIILLLDYGGVLGYDHLIEQEEKLALTLGMTQFEMNKRLSEKSDIGKAFRENKVTEVDFWSTITPHQKVDESYARILTKMWMDTYQLNDSMMDYLQKLRKSIKVGVLTNIDIGRSRLLERIIDINNHLDYYFPSYIFGYSKDTPQLWSIINQQFKNDDIIIYIDDRIEHVLSSEKLGWKGIQYFNFEQMKKQLQILINREQLSFE